MVEFETTFTISNPSIEIIFSDSNIIATLNDISNIQEPTFSSNESFSVGFSMSDQIPNDIKESGDDFNVSIDAKYDGKDDGYYEGNYTVIPKANNEQVLETKNKRLYNDVTVKEVPYYETSNEHGETVYIADGV